MPVPPASKGAGAQSRIVVLPRTGHVAHMEHPGAVAAELAVLTDRVREFPLTPAG